MPAHSIATQQSLTSRGCRGRGGTVRLSSMRKGEAGRIEHLDTGDRNLIQRLVALGILPGATVKLIRRMPAFVVQVDNAQIAMDERMAGHIQVRLGVA